MTQFSTASKASNKNGISSLVDVWYFSRIIVFESHNFWISTMLLFFIAGCSLPIFRILYLTQQLHQRTFTRLSVFKCAVTCQETAYKPVQFYAFARWFFDSSVVKVLIHRYGCSCIYLCFSLCRVNCETELLICWDSTRIALQLLMLHYCCVFHWEDVDYSFTHLAKEKTEICATILRSHIFVTVYLGEIYLSFQ